MILVYECQKMRLRDRISHVLEEYLEAIWRLQEKTSPVKTGELAQQLQVTPGAVTNTLTHLEEHKLIMRNPYRGITLTAKGRTTALRVIRNHRLAERLLTEVLRMDWSDVHDAACELEHAMTDEMIKPLEKTLKEPTTCPHGNPIPDETGRFHEEKSEPLSHFKPKDKAVLVKITDEKSDMLRYLASLGLMPGAIVEVQEKAPFEGPIIVKVMGASYALGRNVASVVQARRV
jgi:DtxR family Mn-dependent transcriptional regulator